MQNSQDTKKQEADEGENTKISQYLHFGSLEFVRFFNSPGNFIKFTFSIFSFFFISVKIEIIRLTFSFCVRLRKIAVQMMSQLILIHVGCGLSHLSSTVGEIYAKQFQPI